MRFRVEATDQPPLIARCVFHYEFELINPFAAGNGRLGIIDVLNRE